MCMCRSGRLRDISVLGVSNVLCMLLISNCASSTAVSEIPCGLRLFMLLELVQGSFDSMRMAMLVDLGVVRNIGVAIDNAMLEVSGCRLLFKALGIAQYSLTGLGLMYMLRMLSMPNCTRDVPVV